MRTFFVPGKGVVIFIIPFCEMTLACGGEVLDTAIEDAETGRVSEIAINITPVELLDISFILPHLKHALIYLFYTHVRQFH